MSYLFSRLPPFAADYSGVASALHDLGGLIVIHDASGCTGSYTGYDEPRWFNSRANVFCSGLREMDAIMGNDEKLLNNIQNAVRNHACNFVAVVGSPVPMLIGFDFEGFANMVEHETGIPAFGFSTTGLGLYDKGLSDAFLEMAKRFVTKPHFSVRRSVNILGASPLDNFDDEALTQISRFLAQSGFSVIATWGQASDLGTLIRSAGATLNLVVSASALPLAQYMKKEWGIPYVVGLPLNTAAAEELRMQLFRELSEPGTQETNLRPLNESLSKRGKAILIGEQVRMNALRNELRRLAPDLSVHVASFFAWSEELAETGDRHLDNEGSAVSWLSDAQADVVVGDPLLRKLLPTEAQERFVDDPHVAVSGRLHRYSIARHFGQDGITLANRILKVCHATTC